MGNRQKVQNRVGRPTHSNVQRHRVFKGFEICDATGQRGLITLFVPPFTQLNDLVTRFFKQPTAFGVGRQQRTVARQSQPQRFSQTVHRVRGEHTRARPTGWAGRTLQLVHFFLAAVFIRRADNGGNEVCFVLTVLQDHLTGFHRATGNKDRRNVQAHRRHQHARRDLVTVGNTHQRVGAMRVRHILHGVGDHFAARQRIEHPVVAHGDAIVHRNGVHLFGHTTSFLNLTCHQLAHVFEVHVPRHKFRKRVDHCHNRLAKVLGFHPRRTP
mmetsp:Transcript_2771/g.4793  ORF Transcript_2771/g.4793 Transcript_2771/m.4793 type:complete len:270 (+) Transcript_2771:1016-1825(+)